MSTSDETESPAELIDAKIEDLGDWRGETLSRVRELVAEADPDVVEAVKWRKPSNPRGVPVWSHGGTICTGETYGQKVKVTFPRGASLEDPAGIFNASLDGTTRRAIDLHEGDELDEEAFRSLVRAAVALTTSDDERPSKTGGESGSETAEPTLLSGGNPQIPKGDGDEPVQAYVSAMPGWKRDVGRRLDELVERTVPDVRKAVRWNSPFYGIEGNGWFLSYHCFTDYVKVTFFRGSSLEPVPPVESKQADVRYVHIHEDDEFDEELVTNWVEQAAELPGEQLF